MLYKHLLCTSKDTLGIFTTLSNCLDSLGTLKDKNKSALKGYKSYKSFKCVY